MPSTVSIAMCTYNGERYLQAQLDSLLAQTRRPDQIVIRDDVSTDTSMDLLRAFVPRAEALGIAVDLQANPQNVGYRRNFDGALRACSGEVIFLCDQDDVWHAGKVARICAEFDVRPRLLAVHSDALLIDGQGATLPKRLFDSLGIGGAELRRMHAGDGLAMMLKRKMVTGAAMALRRRVLEDALPLPTSAWVHDAWIGTLAAMRGDIDSLPEPLIGYRLHSHNQLGLGGNDTRPRHERRRHQLASEQVECEQLLERARTRGVPAAMLAEVDRKRRHIIVRGTLPSSRLRRVPTVLGELLAGNYQRFGRGLLSAGIDLIRA